MIMEAYSIKDDKAGSFWPPMYFSHLVEATRAVQRAMKDPDSKLFQFPSDFSLFLTGKFNQDEGIHIVQPNGPTFIINLINLTNKP